MRIDIAGQGLELTVPLRAYTQERLQFVLSRFHRRITRLQIRIVTCQQRGQNTDMSCRITIAMAHTPQVLVEATAPDMHTAIAQAVDRAGRSVRRWIECQREMATHPWDAASPSRTFIP